MSKRDFPKINGTPWHIEYLSSQNTAEDSDHRHKSNCCYYCGNNKCSHADHLLCNGSAHCKDYTETKRRETCRYYSGKNRCSHANHLICYQSARCKDYCKSIVSRVTPIKVMLNGRKIDKFIGILAPRGTPKNTCSFFIAGSKNNETCSLFHTCEIRTCYYYHRRTEKCPPQQTNHNNILAASKVTNNAPSKTLPTVECNNHNVTVPNSHKENTEQLNSKFIKLSAYFSKQEIAVIFKYQKQISSTSYLIEIERDKLVFRENESSVQRIVIINETPFAELLVNNTMIWTNLISKNKKWHSDNYYSSLEQALECDCSIK